MTAALALLASLFLGIADFLGGALSRRVPQITVLVLSQLIATVAVIPRVVAAPIGVDALPAYGWGVVSGVGAAVGVSALYRALAIGTMGVVAPISALGVLVPVAAGFVGGDTPGVLLLVGMLVAVIGTVCASGPEIGRAPGGGGGGAQPVILALVAALGFGTNNLAVAWGSAHDISATLLANVLATLVIYLIAMAVLRVAPRAGGRMLVGIIAIGVLGFLANLCFAVASESGMLSVVAVCASVFPAVTVVLGWWLLRERLQPVQILGVVLVLGGVALVAVAQ